MMIRVNFRAAISPDAKSVIPATLPRQAVLCNKEHHLFVIVFLHKGHSTEGHAFASITLPVMEFVFGLATESQASLAFVDYQLQMAIACSGDGNMQGLLSSDLPHHVIVLMDLIVPSMYYSHTLCKDNRGNCTLAMANDSIIKSRKASYESRFSQPTCKQEKRLSSFAAVIV
jgi:hypothetical protein